MLSALAGTNFKTTIGPPALRDLSLRSVALAAGTQLGPYEFVETQPQILVVLNWLEELKARVPAK